MRRLCQSVSYYYYFVLVALMGTKYLNGRKIHYRIKKRISRLTLRYQVEIKDVATGIEVKSNKNRSVNTSWRIAEERLTSALMAAGKVSGS